MAHWYGWSDKTRLEMQALPPGWDGESAKELNKLAIVDTMTALQFIIPTSQSPHVMLTEAGGIELQWRSPDALLSFMLSFPGDGFVRGSLLGPVYRGTQKVPFGIGIPWRESVTDTSSLRYRFSEMPVIRAMGFVVR